MSQEKNRKDKKSILNILWAVMFVTLVLGSLIFNNLSSVKLCLSKQAELRDYYMNYLWPELYSKINILYAIIVATCGLTYYNAATDVSVGISDRSVIHIKNLSVAITAISSGIYVAAGVGYFKTVGIITVIIVLAVALAMVSFVVNAIEYKKLDKDETASEVLKPVIIRLLIIIVVIAVGSILIIKPLPKKKNQIDKYYNSIYYELVKIGFGHREGLEDNRVLVKYEFVRRYSDSGREYDLEQLKQKYKNYISGDGSWSNLWYFCHDSVDIELQGQQTDIYTEFYPYSEDVHPNSYDALWDYYNIKGRQFEDKLNALDDKMEDLKFYCVCVEEELNSKGLTLKQENDSSGGKFTDQFDTVEIKTATKEEVLAACDKVDANLKAADGNHNKETYAYPIEVIGYY